MVVKEEKEVLAGSLGVGGGRASMDADYIFDWQHLRGPDFAKFDRARTVVCVACSPLEVHGPHLPMLTDYLEAESLMNRTMELLHEQHEELVFVRLPPLYTAADVVPQVGSMAFRTSTIIRVLEDIGRSLAKQGFRHIWVSSFHGGPRHFTSIEVACDRTNRRYGTQMISVFGLLLNRLTGGNTDLSAILGHLDGISAGDLDGDTHGGLVETAMMLHLLGEQVDPTYCDLPQMNVAIKEASEGRPVKKLEGRPSLGQLIGGFRAKLKYYETETYAGKPSVATAALGRSILDTLAGLSAEGLSALWQGQIHLSECHSPLWRVRWLFTMRWFSWCFERLFRYKSQVW